VKIHILTANIYLRSGIATLAEQLGYVINVINPESGNYLDEVNFNDLVVFHADKREPLLLSKILSFSGKTKLMLIGSHKLRLETLCSINEVVDERAPVGMVLHMLKSSIKAQRCYEDKYISLSDKERMILIRILSGATANVIARQVGLSAKTVYAHKTNAFRKLGAKTIHDILPLKNIIFEREYHMKLGVSNVYLGHPLTEYYENSL